MTQEKELSHSEQQAKTQLECICEMVASLKAARAKKDEEAIEAAQETIREDPLTVEVRSGWVSQIDEDTKPEEYCILLCTGGPACRIVGELNQHKEPETARIEHQDWGTPWTEYRIKGDEEKVVLEYVACFYFGE